MKARAIVLALGAAITVASCSAAQNHDAAQNALTGSQILCILATSLTNEQSIADICAIDKVLVPLIRPFLAQKEAAQARAVARRCGPSDAGADAP